MAADAPVQKILEKQVPETKACLPANAAGRQSKLFSRTRRESGKQGSTASANPARSARNTRSAHLILDPFPEHDLATHSQEERELRRSGHPDNIQTQGGQKKDERACAWHGSTFK
jgi:hypothetical protein